MIGTAKQNQVSANILNDVAETWFCLANCVKIRKRSNNVKNITNSLAVSIILQ